MKKRKLPVIPPEQNALIQKLNWLTGLALDMCGAYGPDTISMRKQVRAYSRELRARILV